jgi:hypothetical protein
MSTTGHMTGQYRIWLALLMLAVPQALASVCTIIGYVNYEDGRPADASLRIVDLDIGTSYMVKTGGKGWPMQNFYVKSFTCNWNDNIEITLGSEIKSISYDKYPYEVNFTIRADVEEKPESGAGGGGGGGGPSVPDHDFGRVINQSEVNKISNSSRIRWYVVNDTLGIKMVVGEVAVMDDYVIVRFSTGLEARFGLHETKELDLDGDGRPDTRGELVELKDGNAYLFFDRIVQVPKDLIIGPEEKAPELVKPMQSKTNRSLIALGILLAISFALVIITDRTHRK